MSMKQSRSVDSNLSIVEHGLFRKSVKLKRYENTRRCDTAARVVRAVTQGHHADHPLVRQKSFDPHFCRVGP